MYDRKEKKKMAEKIEEAKKKESAMADPEELQPKLTDYELNKLKIGKSHIELPTCSSYSSTTRRNPSATQRGTSSKYR